MHGRETNELGETLAFELYRRTGLQLQPETMQAFAEFKSKGNPYHDPEDGRFTFKPGGGALPPRRSSDSARLGPVSDFLNWMRGEPAPKPQSTPAPQPTPTPAPTPSSSSRRNYAVIGQLSAKHESWGEGDPGTVSSGANDPGGISYGKHQYSSTKGTAARFVQSPEASRWTSDFRGLIPGSPQFSAKWREVSAREPAGFGGAQDAYTGRTHYDDKVRGVLRQTGLDLDRSSVAVQQAAFSVSVQHGGAEGILRAAVLNADRHSKRSESSYEVALINSIYDQRTEYVARLREQARAARRLGDAQTFDNIVKNRYPLERRDALRLLATGDR